MNDKAETLDRVQKALNHLQFGLATFVASAMQKKFGPGWKAYASRAAGSGPKDDLDSYAQLKTIIDNWNEVFRSELSSKARAHASVAFAARNAAYHHAGGLDPDEGLSYLYAFRELLLAAKNKQIADKVNALYDEQIAAKQAAGVVSTGLAEPATPAPKSAAAQFVLTLTNQTTTESGLKPWIQVALPHPDVLANRFQEAEFAADLTQVDMRRAQGFYQNGVEFFHYTYLTEGIRRVLGQAIDRWCSNGGDPVIGLQTAFGGGKTHTMLALWHLANAEDRRALKGIAPLIERAGAALPQKIKVFVFVGTGKGPNEKMSRADEPAIRTPWGYLAWKLAGEAGFADVAESEAARTNPGSEALMGVLAKAGPCLILFDELVAYARQLDGLDYEAFLTFIQSLTEAVKATPGALLVGSLPESKAEAGGERGEAALARLEKIFGRIQSAWLPATGNETFEIIRRRLFQELSPEAEKDRDATVRKFHDMYKTQSAEFPPEAKEARYLELLRLSYPIHPELFERLSKDWASLPNFQRTRGVLKFMANVIGVLWNRQPSDPLIMPARIPIADDRIRASILYPLDAGFGAVVDREVDGESSLPARMETNPQRRMTQAQAARRAARAVFLCSAPLVGQPNAGVTGQGLRLAAAEPGDQLAIFGEALRELGERAAYLYEEGGRYWFSTQPTLNRVADDRAKAFSAEEIDDAIIADVREDARNRGGFTRIHAAPDNPTDVDDSADLGIVILGPAWTHLGRGAVKSPALDLVADDILLRSRSSQRRFRNALVFVAADAAELERARENVRRRKAWTSIVEDTNLVDTMTTAQKRDAEDKAKHWRESSLKAIRTAWSHILYPIKDVSAAATGKPFDIEHLAITARERRSIADAAYEKCRSDGVIKEKLGAETLAETLAVLWPAGQDHLAVRQVAGWFAEYPYMPKLKHASVLANAITEAVGSFDAKVGFASGRDEASGRYSDLALARAVPVDLGSPAILVTREAAKRQIDSDAAVKVPAPAASLPLGDTAVQSPGATLPAAADSNAGSAAVTSAPVKVRRFFGSVDLDPARPIPGLQKVVENIIAELQRTPGVRIQLTLEIAAEADNGFDEGDASVIRDNAKALKFRDGSTGFEG